jgi:outer membrane protein OmpA-like peptidoglycan-associated protein
MFFARVGTLLTLLLYCFILAGCAYSDVERNVTSNIDKGLENTRVKVSATSESSIADSYQNASQQTKGALLGGAAGGLTGAAISSVGIIPGMLVGSIFGASYGSYIDSRATVADRLQNRGATIVVLGDHVLIVLPSARIFEDMSSKIKPDAYSTLNLVARYINQYTKMLVKISSYTNHMNSADIALCLSQEQAESISRYFVATGLDARLLYAVGYGGMNPVQRSTNAWNENDNYRIEITLEKEYV